MKKYISKIVLLWLVIFLICAALATGQDPNEETLAQIEKILERYKPENPGGQLSISKNGKIRRP